MSNFSYLCPEMRKNKALPYIIQLIGWGIVFGFPLFLTWKGPEVMTWTRYLGYVFVPVAFMIVFYANYSLLIDRILFRKNLLQFLLSNVILFIVLNLGLEWWRSYYFLHYVSRELPHAGPPKIMFMFRDLLMMGLTAALSVAIRMTENWYVIEGEKRELEKVRTEAELQNLKSQLNPHFLFNTLNNIYSLIAVSPDRAQYAVHALSRMLRHVLYEDKEQFVVLEQELLFIKSYIELMSLRLSEKTDLQVSIPEDGHGKIIAPLLFISLIENAFKHGISPSEPSFIYICLKLEDRKIYCRIENSNFPKKDNDRSGSGIGLANLHKRLDLLYPGQYSLETGVKGDKFVACLQIDLQ